MTNKDNPFSIEQEAALMQQALQEGRKGLGLTSPNPPVGAVIVADCGEVLGRGFHKRAGSAHAEAQALRDAISNVGSERVKGANLFVTLEPCSTHGRTPPCCDAILEAGIRRVFVGVVDPNPRHVGAAREVLEARGVSYRSGVLENEALELIRFFSRHVQTGLPYVIAKTAMTLSGNTTLCEDRGQWISSEESRGDVQRLRSQCDAVLVGGETARRDDPKLTLRGHYAANRSQPLRVVLTSRELPQELGLLNDRYADRTRVYTNRTLLEVLQDLGKQGVTSVLMESGGRLLSDAIDRELVDEVVLYLAPIIGGGETRLMPDQGIIADLKGLEVKSIGRDIRVTGKIMK